MGIRRYCASPDDDDLLLAWLRNQLTDRTLAANSLGLR